MSLKSLIKKETKPEPTAKPKIKLNKAKSSATKALQAKLKNKVPPGAAIASSPGKSAPKLAEGTAKPVTPPTVTADVVPSASLLTDDDKFIHEEQPDKFEQEQVEKIKNALEILKNSLDDPDLVSEAIKNILTHLQEHPFLSDILAPEDLGMMVRGLRKSYGITIAKKKGKAKKKAANQADVDEVASMLSDMVIDI